jgi:hypothetical protein
VKNIRAACRRRRREDDGTGGTTIVVDEGGSAVLSLHKIDFATMMALFEEEKKIVRKEE